MRVSHGVRALGGCYNTLTHGAVLAAISRMDSWSLGFEWTSNRNLNYALYHSSISYVKSAWLLAADSFGGAYHVAFTPCSQAGTYVH
jgi:hypothetical protein